jgi:hypothetical protein
MRKSFTRFLSLLFVFCLVVGIGVFTKVNAQNPAQETVKLYASTSTSCYTKSNVYSITVSVKDFNKLSSFNLGLIYPGSVFSYSSAEVLPGWTAGSINVTEVADGTLSLTWTGSETSLGTNPSSAVDIIRLNFSLDNSVAPSSAQLFTWGTKEFHYTIPSSPSPLDYAFTGSSTNGSLTITQSYSDIVATIAPETCSGGNAKVTVTSPTGVYYSFNGNPFSTSNEFVAIPGNPVNIVVKSTSGTTDGCISYVKTVNVPQTVAPVTFEVTRSNPTCYGYDASVFVTAAGGTATYTYYYNTIPSLTGATSVSNLQFNVPTTAASTGYYINVQDSKGCANLADGNVEGGDLGTWKLITVQDTNTAVTVSSTVNSDVTCNGGNNGNATVSITPAAVYYVALDGGTWTKTSAAGTFTYSTLVAGTHTVTAKTVSDCTLSSTSFVVEQPDALKIESLAVSDTSCGGSNDGVIAVAVSGGGGTYTFTVTGSYNGTPDVRTATNTESATFTGLYPVYYSLTAVDANGCSVSYSNPNGSGNVITVQDQTDIQFSVSAPKIKCYGGTSTATISGVTGGSGLYKYRIDGGALTTSTVFGGLSAGTHTATVQNASGAGCAIEKPFVVDSPSAALVASIASTTSPTCPDGTDGDITLNITGGTILYSYKVNNGPVVSSVGTVSHILAGVGTITISVSDAAGCTATDLVTVITQNTNSITATSSHVILCNGDQTGTISATVNTWAGNRTNQVYKYASSAADVYTAAGKTLFEDGGTATPTYFGAGTYYVGAIDGFGCTATPVKVEIKQNDPVQFVGTIQTTSTSCYNTYDGVIAISAKGGTSSGTDVPLQYAVVNENITTVPSGSWKNMTDYSTASKTYSVNAQATKGRYKVFVRDLNCGNIQYPDVVVVNGYDQLLADESKITLTQPLCNGGKGSITVPVVTGGNGTYKYTLYKSGVAVTGHIQQATGVFGDLVSGTYTVKVEDSTGCPSYTTTNTYTITEPSKVYFTVTKTNITCNGANDGIISIDTHSSGTYSSSVTTNQYSYAINNQNLWVGFAGTTKSYVATQPGTFTIWVKDINGCTSTSTSVNILEPATISATATVTKNAICNLGGEVKVTAAGGWTGTATTTFKFKLDNGSYGSTGTSTTFTNIAAGTHSVTVQAVLASEVDGYVDNSECVKVLYFQITKPDAISYNVTLSDVKCKDSNSGSLKVTVLGGGTSSSTGGYQVNLTGPSYDSGLVWTGTDKEVTFDNLYTGIYTVRIQDVNGCTLDPSVNNKTAPYTTIESWNIQQPSTALAVSATKVSDAKCNLGSDGIFTISATGGVGPYKFFTAKSVLPDHIVLPDVNDNTSWVSVQGSTYTMTAASKGTWIVWAQDANGCVVGGEDLNGVPVNAWRVKIAAPDPITFTVGDTTTPTCNGKADGSIAINSITGGTATYTISVIGTSTANAVINKTVTTTTTSATVTGLPASSGYYTITLSDANGCLAETATKTINEPAALSVALKVSDGSFTCPGAVEGWIDAKATGGTAGYKYRLYKDNVLFVTTWQTISTFLVQVGHVYTVEAIDKDGSGTCTATASINIDAPKAISVSFEETTCWGDAKGSANVIVTGQGGRTYTVTYQGNTEATPTTATNYKDGKFVINDLIFANQVQEQNFYTFYVTDNMGCTASTTRSFVPTQTQLLATVAGVGSSATVTITGGIAPYSYSVGSAAATKIDDSASGGSYSIAGIVNGTNSISVFDAHGCPSSSNVIVYVADMAAPTATYTPNGTATPTEDNYPTLVVKFSEDVAIGAGNVNINKVSDGSTVVTIPASAITVSGSTATLVYAGGLDKDTQYYVTIDAGVVKDLANNNFAGVTSSSTWTFKTGNKFKTDVPDPVNTLEFKVYPNPFVDYVTIANASELSKVVVSNIAGQVVKEVAYPTATLQLSELRSGVYFVTLYQDEKVVNTVKLLKR